MPIFAAPPDPSHPTGFSLPVGWQQTTADPTVIDEWRPGWALCAVTGHVLDLIDIDPRSGGHVPDGLPPGLASAATPSRGWHHFVLPLGVRSRDGVWPGVDVKSGLPDGSGRGFAYIAPTVRQSKVDGTPQTYVWDQKPQSGRIRDAVNWARTHGNPGAEPIRRRIEELRSVYPAQDGPVRRIPRSVARTEWDRACARLADDLRHWAANGWGGEAHAGLLAHTTHLARLSPEHAEDAYLAAFAEARLTPDLADLAKLHSAIETAVPDVVVDDADMHPQELFWAGALAPVDEPPGHHSRPPGSDAPGPESAPSGELARRGGFHFLTEEELSGLPTPDPLIGGLFWRGTVARVFGPSTVGKTWVALDLAAHVALGMPWQGRAVEQGAVVYVAAEGAPTVGPRLAAWRSYHGRPRTGVLTWPEPVMIGGPDWGDFARALKATDARMSIFDTQAAMMMGRKESDNDDMNDVIRALRALAEHVGCCVLLVHHNGWAEEDRARGASSTYAGLDTELQLVEGRGEREVILKQRKQRYAERGKPVRLRLRPHAGQLVVVGPEEGREDFFDGSRELERTQNAERLFRALQAMQADPSASADRSLLPRLRETHSFATQDLVRAVARVYKAKAGLPVELQPDEHEWYARW
jgi:hypothetical protein